MDEIAKLHPAAQVAFILACGSVACVFFYGFWKAIRGR